MQTFRVLVVVVVVTVFSATVVQAQAVRPPADVSHFYALSIAGQAVTYAASWSELALRDESGVPQATISATSYVRTNAGARAKRPVVFAFNGGPGASSSPLAFGILGPKLRTSGSGGVTTFTDNANSLLDVADLVFIDPVGTGFSRELIPGGDKIYFSPEGDAKAVNAFIRDWLAKNGREGAPIYIIGESYGGYRLCLLADLIGDLNIDGLVMVSPGISIGERGDELSVFDLPSMAVIAHYQTGTKDGRSEIQVFNEAQAFAEGDYLLALQKGSMLPPAERDEVAARVASLLSLPKQLVLDQDLRVDSQVFLENVEPDKIVGRLDGRVSDVKPAPRPASNRPKAADDPALNMKGSNIIRSKAIGDFLRTQVGAPGGSDEYVSLSLDVNFAWNWNTGAPGYDANFSQPSVVSQLASLMTKKPKVQLLVFSGYYDLATPVLSQIYPITHSAIPAPRVQFVTLPEGHGVYGSDASRGQVAKRLRAFIAQANE